MTLFLKGVHELFSDFDLQCISTTACHCMKNQYNNFFSCKSVKHSSMNWPKVNFSDDSLLLLLVGVKENSVKIIRNWNNYIFNLFILPAWNVVSISKLLYVEMLYRHHLSSIENSDLQNHGEHLNSTNGLPAIILINDIFTNGKPLPRTQTAGPT